MLERIINQSIRNKLMVLLFTATIIGFGLFALTHIPIGAVPDVTNNQVQVITTSRNLSTQDVEQFLTYPIELEMANLPGVTEIRSVSKFGLSVVTIVFEDKIGTYLPRQLIAEKIKSASEKIPAGFGSPEMGPVSTGLGEIYQYILDVKPGYDSLYSIMDLRTIQDWIVKRRLSGIPGVVEVNTWGGFLKQYEVAVNPERLRSIDVSVSDVYSALESNNSVAGGGYIEKVNESYFIRAEGLVGSIEDIENIIIKNREGKPIFIKDVAAINYGSATRFGAITGNGEGEKVLGQVMMLKDANSKEVIENVKKRVAEIQTSLPEGVYINGFLERSELIGKTTATVAENLILGCLIVIFVVVLLLGNFRSGLVVASVIPLSLLFALSMMYVFGVDANLMSLGAIDFGIIIDGAVIIVEFIAFQITDRRDSIIALPKADQQDLIDNITYDSANKMMHSAVFGQLIIIIVFIPILSLANVEGKMFKPMAMTFCFALIGAMILCFTYVPVAASLFLKPAKRSKRNISDQLMAFAQWLYTPVITFALAWKRLVLGLALLLLIGTVLLFNTMGGEFVPTLDEGDFVIQPVLKTGTSLSKTIEATTRMEKILKTFPEVDQVVSRIGAAEVPTDPMSMEESDVIIKLKPHKEWVTAESKDELADKFKEALSEIPGVDYEFTQPIEMRFNELITGVRADLAIKIFGEDLGILNEKAQEIRRLIQHVPGASDITVEKVAGLPQMSVKYNRSKIAKYGLNISDLNKAVSMGFAGLPAGSVFEGEKRFDLVIRYDQDFRKDIRNLQNTYIDLPGGAQVPLRELAEITNTVGPAKISRDNTHRRIVVGVNVRNRDLESVVKDVQGLIEQNIQLPVGYSISYGGQFENLRSARQRLLVAVPIALVLIFVMLHFAFKSVKEALMVYSAIPLSAVGGVLLLWLRGMPFSISAGVGFIALFGIAVLNGIVLIEHFKELKAHGMTDIKERILTGTKQRLRPVLLTAAAAALGFLPMALSTSAGAEVQRPLATVVVGGLFSATLLTLVVLPVLYSLFDRKGKGNRRKAAPIIRTLLLLLAIPALGYPQTQSLTLEQAVDLALANNARLRAGALEVDKAQLLIPAAYNIDKTSLYFNRDNNNIAPNGQALNVWGVQQNLPFPTTFGKQKKVNEGRVQMQAGKYQLDQRMITREVSKTYYNIVHLQALQDNYRYLDSLYARFAGAAARKFELGESNYLEKLTAQTKLNELRLQLQQGREDLEAAWAELYKWMQADGDFIILPQAPRQLPLTGLDTASHPGLLYYQKALATSEWETQLEKSKLLPDLHLEYFQGSNNGPEAKTYRGFQFGVAIPIWQKAHRSLIDASRIQQEIIRKETLNYQKQLNGNYHQLAAELRKYQEAINYYNESGLILAEETLNAAQRAFQGGEIDFFQYIQLLENARSIRINYLENLHRYNQTVLEMNYLMN